MAKRQFTREFKIQALELAQQLGNTSEAARQLGIGNAVLYSWSKKFNISLDARAKPAATAVIESEEMKRLRKENDELKKTNYILKKAAAFFSQGHLK